MSCRNRINAAHPFWKALIWIGLMIMLTTLMMVAYLSYVKHTGLQSVAELRALQVAQSFAVFIIPSILAAWCWTSRPFRWLRMDRPVHWDTAALIILTILVALPGINLLADLNSRIELPDSLSELEAMLKQQEEASRELTESFLQANSIWGMLANVCLMALLPALGEEMCFRGTMLGLLNQDREHIRQHIAIWIVAIVFSAIHMQFYGFIPRMLLGALLGYLLLWTGSLWAPVLAHFTNNATAVVTYYIAQHTDLSEEAVDSLGTGDQWWLGLLSLGVTGIMIWRIAVRKR